MGKSQQSFNKKEREKKRQKKRKEKAERKQQRKEDSLNKKSTDEFMYVDEYGNLTLTPPNPDNKIEIDVNEIQISTPKKGELDTEDLIRKGIVKFFNTEKGYGFINDKKTMESVFVHVGDLIDDIKKDDQVTFVIQMGPKGPQAVSVKLNNSIN